MTVFFTNAEEKLVEYMERLYAERQPWKMTVFVGNKTNREFSEQLYSKNSDVLFVDAANETEAVIFRCQDNEVVFLYRQRDSIVQPRLKRLMLDIFSHVTENDIDFDSAFYFYNLSIEFDQAMGFANEKLRLERYRAQFRNGNIVEAVIPTWNDEVFNRALHRRSARRHALVALVEDEVSIRHMAGMILRHKYNTVITADNGCSALDLYNEYAPDLMFLDINMPAMNGIEVLKRILRVDKDASIIMFTVNNNSDEIKAALQLGAKGYVVKPFIASALLNQAEHILVKPKRLLRYKQA